MEIGFTTIEKVGFRFVVEDNEHFKSVLSEYPEIEKRFSYVKGILDKSLFRDVVQLGVIVKFNKAWYIPVIDGSKKAENKIHAYSGLFKQLRNELNGKILVSTTESKHV